MVQTVKDPPEIQEIRVPSLGWEDPLDKGAWWATVHGAAKSQT